MVTNFATTERILPNHYQIKTAKKVEDRQVIYEYNPDNPSDRMERTVITSYASAYHQAPTSESQISNRGTEKKQWKYTPDLTACQTFCSQCYDVFKTDSTAAANQLSLNVTGCANSTTDCSQFEGTADNGQTCTSSCQIASWFQYEYDLNEARIAYRQCKRNCDYGSNCMTTGKGSSNNQVASLFYLEDQNQIGSPLETVVIRDDEVLQSNLLTYQTDFSSGTKVYPEELWQLETAVPISDFVGLSLSGSNLVYDADYNTTYPEARLRFSNGRLVEQIDKGGVVTSYLWGLNNTVPIATAVGVGYDALLSAYNADPQGFATALGNAQVTVYSHDPVVGITSKTDPNDLKVTYWYDPLGRLEYIRDHEGNVLQQFEYNYANQ